MIYVSLKYLHTNPCTFLRTHPKLKGTLNTFKGLHMGRWEGNVLPGMKRNKINPPPPFISKEKTLITSIFNIYLIYQEGKKNE